MNKFLWFVAGRYFISKKSTQVISIIMYVSLCAIAITAAAMLIVLAAFSGLQNLNIRFVSEVNPDIKITPYQGKLLPQISSLEKILKEEKNISNYSKVIQEKVYASHNQKDEIAYLKGIDQNYTQVFRIDTCIKAGRFLDPTDSLGIISGDALAYHLDMILDEEALELYVPKAGKGLIKNTNDAFKTEQVYMRGVFFINDQYQNYIFTSIDLARNLLDISPNDAYSIEIKVKDKVNKVTVKEELQERLGSQYKVETREEQDASYLKMMKIERLFIFLIFILIIIISSFNLAGAIIIIILDKKTQSKTLIMMGISIKQLKFLFFRIGVIVVFSGLLLGLFCGTIILFLQKKLGFIKVNAFMDFPISFQPSDYLIVIFTVLGIGLSISYISSRRIRF